MLCVVVPLDGRRGASAVGPLKQRTTPGPATDPRLSLTSPSVTSRVLATGSSLASLKSVVPAPVLCGAFDLTDASSGLFQAATSSVRCRAFYFYFFLTRRLGRCEGGIPSFLCLLPSSNPRSFPSVAFSPFGGRMTE